MAYLDRVKHRLEELHFIRPGSLLGCTEEEIVQLEQELGYKLPAAYKEFLLWMGHTAGSLFTGSECLFRDIPSIQHWAVELLTENQKLEVLPSSAFVYFMHQGYMFSFFHITEGDDPPTFTYREKEEHGSFSRDHAHYSDALLAYIEDTAKIVSRLAQGYITGQSWSSPPLEESILYYLEKQ